MQFDWVKRREEMDVEFTSTTWKLEEEGEGGKGEGELMQVLSWENCQEKT